MKRLILGALALLLTSGALVVEPVYACVIDPACASQGCRVQCGPDGGICNTCSGRCLCY